MDAVILVFDITNSESFEFLTLIMDEVKQYASEGRPNKTFLLLGNKLDEENKRQVSKEDAMKFGQEHNCAYHEISAKDGTNILECFRNLTRQTAQSQSPV